MSQGITFLTKLFGIGFFQIRAHSVQIGDSLLGSHSRLQMSYRLKDPMRSSARIQEIFSIYLVLVDDRHIRRGPDQRRLDEAAGQTPAAVDHLAALLPNDF